MTTETSPSPSAAPRRSLGGWFDPALLRRRGRSLGQRVAAYGVIVVLAVLESSVLAPLMEVVLNVPTLEAWVVSATISVAGAYVMHSAGRTHAGTGLHRSGDGRARVVLKVAVWAVAGVVITAMRVIGMATSTDVQGIGRSAGNAIEAADVVAAGLFLVLFAMAGVIAFSQGMDRNDAHEALVLAEEALDDVREKLLFWEAQLTRMAQEIERRQDDVSRIDRLAEVERSLSAHVRDSSSARVRTELGRLKGDPSVMGVASPEHPEHPVASGRAA